jgi:hypothetical protein
MLSVHDAENTASEKNVFGYVVSEGASEIAELSEGSPVKNREKSVRDIIYIRLAAESVGQSCAATMRVEQRKSLEEQPWNRHPGLSENSCPCRLLVPLILTPQVSCYTPSRLA